MGKKKNKFKQIQSKQTISNDISAADAIKKIENGGTADVAKSIAEDDDEIIYAYVKRDTKKILLFLVLVFALLAVSYFVNSKTTIFQSFGDWIYKIANIKTL